MAALPASVAITPIADGSLAIAADIRNDFLALQVFCNSLLANLDDALAGQVLNGTSTTMSWAYPPGFEINYTQITSSVNIVSTTEATGTSILAPGAITFDGAPVLVEFFSPFVQTPSNAAADFAAISLFEGATQIGRLAFCQTPAAAITLEPVRATYRFTPSAGSHTYSITAHVNSTTGTPRVGAGAGGTAAFVPAFVRFVKV